MAESPLDRLKRIAAEKKAAAVPAKSGTLPAPAQTPVSYPPKEEIKDEQVSLAGTDQEERGTSETKVPDQDSGRPASSPGDSNQPSSSIPAALETPTPRDHPLAMQFAELAGLLESDAPGFKVLLRDIHRQLGMEPELVTMMSEEEVQLVVTGMVVLANAEIIEPAKVKAAKAGVAAAKKRVISVDDL